MMEVDPSSGKVVPALDDAPFLPGFQVALLAGIRECVNACVCVCVCVCVCAFLSPLSLFLSFPLSFSFS